jgi:hypothetical protein
VGSRRARLLLGTALALLLSAAPAVGQPPPQRPPRDTPPPGAEEMMPGELWQLFDAMLMMQAPKALALSDSQYGQFVPRLRTLQNTRRRHQVERSRLLRELQQLLNRRGPAPDANEGRLRERLAALQELESRHAAELRRAYNGIDDVLDIYQQARFRVFEEQMERRKLELIGRARQNLRKDRREPPPF